MDELPGGIDFTNQLLEGVRWSISAQTFALALEGSMVFLVYKRKPKESTDFACDAIILPTEIAQASDWIDVVAMTTIGKDHDTSICRYGRGVSTNFMEDKVLDG